MCGCDCGGCGGIPFCTGNLLVIVERLFSYLALTAVVCCIVILFAVSMGIGIGLGYNYCVVDMKVQTHTAKPAALRQNIPEENPYLQVDETRRRMSSRSNQPDTDFTKSVTTEVTVATEKYTLTMPLQASNMDFIALLGKLRSRNKNITLELIT